MGDLWTVLPTWPLPVKRSRQLSKIRLDFLTHKCISAASMTPRGAFAYHPGEQVCWLLRLFLWEASGNSRNPSLCQRQSKVEEGFPDSNFQIDGNGRQSALSNTSYGDTDTSSVGPEASHLGTLSLFLRL